MTFTPGIYPIYKPKGITSFDVIFKLRKMTGIKKIGHAGTLDPLASGVLVVAIGREYTKQLEQLTLTDKEYEAEITLGQTSTTDDDEGEKTQFVVEEVPSENSVHHVVQSFIGEINQLPPVYSAIKVKGVPAHRRVRKGQTVDLKPRKVVIHDIEIVSFSWPLLGIKVHCGKGVYIRSLARDIGERLKVGGYLSELIRTRVGEYRLEDAVRIE